jgi:hypothetical protein
MINDGAVRLNMTKMKNAVGIEQMCKFATMHLTWHIYLERIAAPVLKRVFLMELDQTLKLSLGTTNYLEIRNIAARRLV